MSETALISRQEAIDELIAMREYIDSRMSVIGCTAYEMAIEALREPERATGKWIPCSERLPDIGEHHVSEPCIVYCSNGAYGFAELEENIFGQVWWNCECDDEYHEPLGEVLAWMPLPSPYKEEQ